MYKETKYKIYNKKIKKNINILHISDIHFYKLNDINFLDKLYNKLNNYKTDYIIITGDILDENRKTKDKIVYLKNWIMKLSKISKVIIGLGNHDTYYEDKKKYFNDYNSSFWNSINKIKNVYVLNNSNYEDKNIFVYGYTPAIEYYYPKEKKEVMLQEIKEYNINEISLDKYNICLIHSPFFLSDKEVENSLDKYDLILSGHMHNGLVPPILDEIFNNTRGIITRDKLFFKKMCRNFYKNKYISIISSGINKLHSNKIYFINLFNIFFPRGLNIIELKNKKCKFTNSYKYTK